MNVVHVVFGVFGGVALLFIGCACIQRERNRRQLRKRMVVSFRDPRSLIV